MEALPVIVKSSDRDVLDRVSYGTVLNVLPLRRHPKRPTLHIVVPHRPDVPVICYVCNIKKSPAGPRLTLSCFRNTGRLHADTPYDYYACSVHENQSQRAAG